MTRINISQLQLASPPNRLRRHIRERSFIVKWGSAAAGAAAGVGRVAAVAAVTAVAVVENQDDGDDEQQPRAVDVAAKQIAQAHTVSSFPKAAYSAFISIL